MVVVGGGRLIGLPWLFWADPKEQDLTLGKSCKLGQPGIIL